MWQEMRGKGGKKDARRGRTISRKGFGRKRVSKTHRSLKNGRKELGGVGVGGKVREFKVDEEENAFRT